MLLVGTCSDPDAIDYVMLNLRPDRRFNIADPAYDRVMQVCQLRKAELALMVLTAQQIEKFDKLTAELSKLDDDKLKAKLKDPDGDVRLAALMVIVQKRRPLQGEVIALLADKKAGGALRQMTRQALIHLSRGTDFGPTPDDGPDDRALAVRRWREWWARQDYNPNHKEPAELTTVPPAADPDKDKPKPADEAKVKLDAARLADDLQKANADTRESVLAKLQERKGGAYTQALAGVIAKLDGMAKDDARTALVERLTRMTAATLKGYLTGDDAELRRAAALATAIREDKALIPQLIDLLDDSEADVARAAKAALKSLSGEDFGPGVKATDKERAEAVKKWRAWWEKRAEK
jgi:hypothetical protein